MAMIFRQKKLRAFFAVALITKGSIAQTLDPSSILKQVQSQNGGQSISTSSAIDRARNNAQDANTTSGTLSSDLRDQLDAQKLRYELDSRYEPTAVETEMRRRTGNTKLRQFGYGLFGNRQNSNEPLTGAVSESYVLGIGDELVILFQGSTTRSITTRVDREGRLVVDQLRPVVAAGRTFGAVRRDLEAATKATLLGTDVFLSLGSTRAITVLVGGAVNRPGTYPLTSLSDVTAAIARAGGIQLSGSLRRVRVVGNGRTATVDLYGLMGIGAPPSVRLRDGDRIIVPTLGPVVALSGGIARPGIYELPLGHPLTIGQAVTMAGGPLRPTGNDIVLGRFDRNGNEKLSSTRSFGMSVAPGDVIIVNPREKGIAGRVSLSGFVDSPGLRSLNAAPTVQALLGAPENLKPGSYLPLAVLIRLDPVTRARQYRAVDLVAALTRGRDISLRGEDDLVLISERDVRFMQSEDVRRIVLGEANPKPECKALGALEMLVRDTQSDRFAAVIRGSFIVDKQGRATLATASASQNRFGVRNADNLAGQNTQQNDVNPTTKDELLKAQQLRLQQQSTGQQDPNNASYAGGSFDTGEAGQLNRNNYKTREELADLELQGLNKYGCPKLFEEKPDVLPFLLEHAAVISGAVRKPGAYPVASDSNLSTLVSVAEGLAIDADPNGVEIASTNAATQNFARQTIALAKTRMVDVLIAPGDDVRFRGRQPAQEPGAILLSGEFVRPGLYSIAKGETLSQLVARAGGVSTQAYPYGAIFTRRTVKLAEQEGFKRASRELNQALLAASSRKSVPSDSILAASSLATSLATTEAPGRVVVEADPRVLARRTDLDTVLEAGDAIFMPKRPNFVLAIGDVLNPNALQFIAGKPLKDYVAEAGGLQPSADKKHVFLVYPNGQARPLTSVDAMHSRLQVPPGSSVVVPKNVDPLAKLDLIRDIGTILSQFAVSAASIALLLK